MIFHENRLLEDDSYEISYIPYFFRKLQKMSQNLSSAAVVIGVLRVKGKFLLLSKKRRKCIKGFERLKTAYLSKMTPKYHPRNIIYHLYSHMTDKPILGFLQVNIVQK